jgi:excisionase family DNA binding protein
MANTDQLEALLTLLGGDVRLVDNSGHEVELGAEVVEAFQAAVAEMLAHEANDLTTQEAAKLIGVSRPTLIRLLDTGKLPYRRTNGDHGHRRIPRRAALDYLRADLERRRQALDVLAADAEALGFFDD